MASNDTNPETVTYNVGRWLSAALDDPQVCQEMKDDINKWMEAGEPNIQPGKSWRCFWCDEVFFNREAAAEHFGEYEDGISDTPACKITVEEGPLITYIRKLHKEISGYHQMDNELFRCIEILEGEKENIIRTGFRDAEEKGYNRGVQDMTKQGLCPEPQKHSV